MLAEQVDNFVLLEKKIPIFLKPGINPAHSPLPVWVSGQKTKTLSLKKTHTDLLYQQPITEVHSLLMAPLESWSHLPMTAEREIDPLTVRSIKYYLTILWPNWDLIKWLHYIFTFALLTSTHLYYPTELTQQHTQLQLSETCLNSTQMLTPKLQFKLPSS